MRQRRTKKELALPRKVHQPPATNDTNGKQPKPKKNERDRKHFVSTLKGKEKAKQSREDEKRREEREKVREQVRSNTVIYYEELRRGKEKLSRLKIPKKTDAMAEPQNAVVPAGIPYKLDNVMQFNEQLEREDRHTEGRQATENYAKDMGQQQQQENTSATLERAEAEICLIAALETQIASLKEEQHGLEDGVHRKEVDGLRYRKEILDFMEKLERLDLDLESARSALRIREDNKWYKTDNRRLRMEASDLMTQIVNLTNENEQNLDELKRVKEKIAREKEDHRLELHIVGTYDERGNQVETGGNEEENAERDALLNELAKAQDELLELARRARGGTEHAEQEHTYMVVQEPDAPMDAPPPMDAHAEETCSSSLVEDRRPPLDDAKPAKRGTEECESGEGQIKKKKAKNTNLPKVECETCGKPGTRNHRTKCKFKKMNPVGFACKTCSRVFKYPGALNRHETRFRGKCGKTVAAPSTTRQMNEDITTSPTIAEN